MKKEHITDAGILREGELALINKLTRRPLTEEEVYAFTVTLCDNDIDRDNERFSDLALYELSTLFLGKTGIFDHSHKAENQTARIFSTEVVETEDKTVDGREYRCLRARAYMLRNEKNAALIEEIDAGIKREVSVGCRLEEKRCSICGESRAIGCVHKAGKRYGKDFCHTILSNATDAYEWSFVAVPAQRKAGVEKSKKEKYKMDKDVLKKLSGGEEIILSRTEAEALSSQISALKTLSAIGEQHLSERRASVAKAFSQALPAADEALINSICEQLTFSQLDGLYRCFEKTSAMPQLTKKENSRKNSGFMIK